MFWASSGYVCLLLVDKFRQLPPPPASYLFPFSSSATFLCPCHTPWSYQFYWTLPHPSGTPHLPGAIDTPVDMKSASSTADGGVTCITLHLQRGGRRCRYLFFFFLIIGYISNTQYSFIIKKSTQFTNTQNKKVKLSFHPFHCPKAYPAGRYD